MTQLHKRRLWTEAHIKELKSKLASTNKMIAKKACVYMTGSFGRGEASKHSDLDLFILGKLSGNGDARSLTKLDEIILKGDLIEVTRKLGMPDFSGDGEYLTHYTVHELTRTLGTPDDDKANTFTARLLLLLESKVLIGERVYASAVDEVIAAYFGDYDDHKDDFVPAFLANDILRLWRTFCVNYEAKTRRVPEPDKAKGKLKNYKLKHSRLLTCYSALLQLLSIYRDKGTVSPSDVRELVEMSPTGRLEQLQTSTYFQGNRQVIQQLLDSYNRFLEVTGAVNKDVVKIFMDKSMSRQHLEQAVAFGDLIYRAINIIGGDSKLHRLLVV